MCSICAGLIAKFDGQRCRQRQPCLACKIQRVSQPYGTIKGIIKGGVVYERMDIVDPESLVELDVPHTCMRGTSCSLLPP